MNKPFIPSSPWRLRAKMLTLPASVCAIGVAGVLSVVSGDAVAQTRASVGSDTELQEIVVTGSLIKRTDTETPSPVQVLSAEDIKNMGYTNINQVLANLSANGQGTLSQAFGQAFAAGASGVALRGLSVGDTLVLIDGKRMVDYPISDDNERAFVDVSAIPFNAIDHVEVLKDGGSAIYGADAIGGVVNIILKKDYQGGEFTAEGGTSQKHDGTTEHLAGIYGVGDLTNDGWNAYVAVDFHHSDQILDSNRHGGYTNLDWSSLPSGINTTPGTVGDPYIPYPATTTGYILNPTAQNAAGTYPNGLPGQTFLPGCNSTAQTLNQCSFNWQGLQIQPATTQTNVISKFTKSLGGDWTTSLALSVFESKAEQVCCTYPNTSYASGGVVNLIGSPGVQPSIVPYPVFTLPATYPGNPYGAASPFIYNFHELGLPKTLTDTDTYRAAWDIKGSAAGFDIDGSLGVMYSRMSLKELGNLDPTNLQNALNSGYVIGAGASPTAAFNAGIAPEDISHPTSSLDLAEVHASRTLFQLPGGPFAVAFGASFFHKTENDLPPYPVYTGAQQGSSAFAVGSQNDAAAFAEFNAQPIKMLELDGAVRYDNYDHGVGRAIDPKIAMKFQPFDMFALRGTWSKGFRAPSPAESQQSGSFFGAGTTSDAVLCPNPGTPTAKGNFPSQCNAAFSGQQAPGTNLQPVKSTNQTYGFIFEPSHMFNMSASYYNIKLTNDIISVLQTGGLSAYTSLVRGPSANLPFCTANGVCNTNVTTPVGLIAFGTYPYINAGETKTQGFDVDFHTNFDLGAAGKLSAELQYTHIILFEQVVGGTVYSLAGTHGPSSISGDTGNPKDRAVFTLTWLQGPLTVSGTVNYTSHISITDPSSGVNTCDQGLLYGFPSAYGGRFTPSTTVPGAYCTVRTFTDVNLYAQYNITDNFNFHGSVANLFNAQPPVDLQTYGGGGQLAYDASLNQAGAVGRFFILGATYKFK